MREIVFFILILIIIINIWKFVFDAEFIKTLLKFNLPVNSTNNNKLTPLLVACKIKSSNQLEIVKALLHSNANINCVDDNLMTPLHLACEDQNLDLVIVLLKNGSNPNALNDKDQTPLHIICCKYKSEMTASIIQLLLENGANIEATNVEGWTPLLNVVENIGVNNITFDDLLEENIHNSRCFMKNKKLQQTLELEVYNENFPLHIDLVRSRFRDEKLRCKFINPLAMKYFSANICPQLSDGCLDIVFSYLTIGEIEMFVNTMKSLVGNLNEF